jgi:hypothetical protein
METAAATANARREANTSSKPFTLQIVASVFGGHNGKFDALATAAAAVGLGNFHVWRNTATMR